MEWSREEVLKYVVAMEQLSRRAQRNLIRLTKSVNLTKRNIARARCTHCKQRMTPKAVKADPAKPSAVKADLAKPSAVKADPAKPSAAVKADPAKPSVANPESPQMPTLIAEPVAMDVGPSSSPMSRLVPDISAEIPSSSTMPMPILSPQTLDLDITNRATESVSASEVQTKPSTTGYMAKFLCMKDGNFGIDLNENQCSLHLKVGCWLEYTSTEPSPDLEKEMAAVANELVNTPMEIGISAKRERFFDTIVHEGEDDSFSMDEFITFSRNETS